MSNLNFTKKINLNYIKITTWYSKNNSKNNKFFKFLNIFYILQGGGDKWKNKLEIKIISIFKNYEVKSFIFFNL